MGDSIATAFYGMKSTRSIKLETMINHSLACKKVVLKKVFLYLICPLIHTKTLRMQKMLEKF